LWLGKQLRNEGVAEILTSKLANNQQTRRREKGDTVERDRGGRDHRIGVSKHIKGQKRRRFAEKTNALGEGGWYGATGGEGGGK